MTDDRPSNWFWPLLFLLLSTLAGIVVFLTDVGASVFVDDLVFLASIAAFLFTLVRGAVRHLRTDPTVHD